MSRYLLEVDIMGPIMALAHVTHFLYFALFV